MYVLYEWTNKSIQFNSISLDEYRGHQLLEACRQADLPKVKKQLTTDVVNFKHPHSMDSPLVCTKFNLFKFWDDN